MKAHTYVIISAESLDELQNKVQVFLGHAVGESWLPGGGPIFQKDTSGTWHQAMYAVLEHMH
jgi:hypothetical protein